VTSPISGNFVGGLENLPLRDRIAPTPQPAVA